MNSFETRQLSVAAVSAAVKNDPAACVATEEARYREAVEAVASAIHDAKDGRRFVLLSGPSSSGKTTTAGLLKAALAAKGTVTHVISLDDFYLGEGKAPLLPDGRPDYESIDALNLPLLQACLTDLVQKGETALPQFDFSARCPKAERVPLCLEPDAAVILEGIHAFNPCLGAYLPPAMTTRLFINTLSRFSDANGVWLSRRVLRLVRRILRDDRFRASPFSHTMGMWPQVARGETLYLFPYADTADLVIDTTFAFEPCLFRGFLLPLLAAVPSIDPHADTARRLAALLDVFPPLDAALLPQESMLREFIG